MRHIVLTIAWVSAGIVALIMFASPDRVAADIVWEDGSGIANGVPFCTPDALCEEPADMARHCQDDDGTTLRTNTAPCSMFHMSQLGPDFPADDYAERDQLPFDICGDSLWSDSCVAAGMFGSAFIGTYESE